MLRAIGRENRCVFTIDRAVDVHKEVSLKAGGVGMSYICQICGKTVSLFNIKGLWKNENNKGIRLIRSPANDINSWN